MAAQRGQAFQRVEEGEESAKIAQEAAENGQNEDTARWAAVERRLDQADRARLESEARMAQMMGQMMAQSRRGWCREMRPRCTEMH